MKRNRTDYRNNLLRIFEMDNSLCYCCSMVNKLSEIDYLDLETYQSGAAKRSTRGKTCYLDFIKFSSLLPPPKAGNVSPEESKWAGGRNGGTSPFPNYIHGKKGPSANKPSGEEESSHHICRICENSEAAKITENCLFENFDDFAQHMSRRHNTSVIRITTKSTKNNLRAETDEFVKMFKMPPDVPSRSKASINRKIPDEGFSGQGVIKHSTSKPSISSLSSSIKLINGNFEKSVSTDLRKVPSEKLRINDKRYYHDINDRHLQESFTVCNGNVSVEQQWCPDINGMRSAAIKGQRRNTATSDNLEKHPPSTMTATRLPKPHLLYMGKTPCTPVSDTDQNQQQTNTERFEVKHLISPAVEEIGKRNEVMEQNHVIHSTVSTLSSLKDPLDCGNNIQQLASVTDGQICPTLEESLSLNNLTPRNKRFLPPNDYKQHVIANRDLIIANSKIQKANGPPEIKYENMPCNTFQTHLETKQMECPDLKTDSCTDSSGLITTNHSIEINYSTKGDEMLRNNISTIVPILGSVKRKRGRPPKKGVTSSQVSITSNSFNITKLESNGEQNALHSDGNDTQNNSAARTETLEKEDTNRDINFDGSDGKSETTAKLLQKHLVNRKRMNEMSSANQVHKLSVTVSSSKLKNNHATPSRLSNRLKNYEKLAKQRSEHSRKVEFLGTLGLIETSSVLTYLLDKKCNNKNRSQINKATKINVKPKNKEVSFDQDEIEPPPKKKRGRPPKNITSSSTSSAVKKVVYNDTSEIPLLFAPICKDKSQAESSRSTGRTRKTSQKYSDYVCYY